MSFKVTWKLHILCFLVVFITCLITHDYIINLFIDLLLGNKIIQFTGNTVIDLMTFIVIIFIPITIVHEFIHGSTYKLFGGSVKYGFKGIYAYSQETSGIALHRTKFLIVLLSPVTVISIVSLFIPMRMGEIIFLLNLLGSIGDLLMTVYLCKSNPNSYILDKKYGFDIIDMNVINNKLQ